MGPDLAQHRGSVTSLIGQACMRIQAMCATASDMHPMTWAPEGITDKISH